MRYLIHRRLHSRIDHVEMKLYLVFILSAFSGGSAFSLPKTSETRRIHVGNSALQRSRIMSAASSNHRIEECMGLDPSKLPRVAMGAVLGLSLLWSPAAQASSTDYEFSTADDVSVLDHEYSDPLHPECRRTIKVDKDGKTFHFSGTSVGSAKDDPVLRGCSKEEIKKYGLRAGSFDGQIVMPGLRLSAGDGIHEGQWEPANSVKASTNLQYRAVDGIRWNDGNKWIVKEQTPKPLSTVVGEWIFLAYIGFSTLAGVKGVADKLIKNRNKATN